MVAEPGISVVVRGQPLTAEQTARAEQFRSQLQEEGSRHGIRFDELTLDNQAPAYQGGEGGVKNLGAYARSGKTGLIVNADFLTSGLKKEEMSGAVAHEVWHLKSGNIPTVLKLRAVIQLQNALEELQRSYVLSETMGGGRLPALEKALVEEFSSPGNFDKELTRFEKGVLPYVQELYTRKEGIKTATPEQWARHIEQDDQTCRYLKQYVKALPEKEIIQKCTKSMEGVTGKHNPLEAGNLAPTASSVDLGAIKQVGEKITTLLGKMEKLHLRPLSEGFIKGEEYAADAYALREAPSPDAMLHCLKALVRIGAQATGESETQFLKKEKSLSPSLGRRIKRLEHIVAHGEPPADEMLRPLSSSWGSRITEMLTPSQGRS